MRSRRLVRCPLCGLHARSSCLCADLPSFTPRTQVILVAHRDELRKTTNTAKLSARMLAGARVISSDDPSSDDSPCAGAFLLFPSEHALPLAEACARGVTRLVVPDGTWRQARKIAQKHAQCAGLPHVRIDPLHESRYALRRNERPGGLCTLEAVAECLRVLEGNDMAEGMLAAFAEWVDRATRLRRGEHEQGPEFAERLS